VVYDQYIDPYFEHSTEPDDLVSKGFLSDKNLGSGPIKVLALGRIG
jgi:hypothetical protein